MPGPLPAGCLPTDGDTQVIRRTTTQPVRSIKGQRPRTARSHFLDHVPHINWQTCVAHLLSDHTRASPRLTKGADDHGGGHVPVGVGSGGRLRWENELDAAI